MEQAAPKQRSPWFFVLLGCGGFALLSCLGIFGVMGFGFLKARDAVAGLVDREKATERATQMLGRLPEGYVAVGAMGMFGLEMTQLIKGTALADGGFEDIEREFMAITTPAAENTKDTKAYFKAPAGEEVVNSDTSMRAKDIIKRGNFTIDSQKMYYIVSRGELDMPNMQHNGVGGRAAGGPRLNTAVLFDCPDEKLHMGVWSMPDPAPDLPSKSVDLVGTVGDEAQLVPFLKQMTPCGA